MLKNRLNDLSPKEWIKFQKSWFELNPPRRSKDVLVHPAKFPEELVSEFVRFFTKSGQTVLDPMAGTGSTLLACLSTGRKAFGIELNPKYAAIAGKRIADAANAERGGQIGREVLRPVLLEADARCIDDLDLPEIDYCITSPPYWDMLRQKGARTQRERAEAGLDVFYSSDEKDLGNIAEYDIFVDELVGIFGKSRIYIPLGHAQALFYTLIDSVLADLDTAALNVLAAHKVFQKLPVAAPHIENGRSGFDHIPYDLVIKS